MKVIFIMFSFSLLGTVQNDHLAQRSIESWKKEESNQMSRGELQELLKLAEPTMRFPYMDFQHWLLPQQWKGIMLLILRSTACYFCAWGILARPRS